VCAFVFSVMCVSLLRILFPIHVSLLCNPHISLDARVHRMMVRRGNVRLFRIRFFSPCDVHDLFPNHMYLLQKPVTRRTNSLPPILLSLLCFLSLSAIARLPIPALSRSFFLSLSLHRFPFQYLTSPIPSFSPSHPSCPSFRHSIPAFLIFLILENSACA